MLEQLKQYSIHAHVYFWILTSGRARDMLDEGPQRAGTWQQLLVLHMCCTVQRPNPCDDAIAMAIPSEMMPLILLSLRLAAHPLRRSACRGSAQPHPLCAIDRLA